MLVSLHEMLTHEVGAKMLSLALTLMTMFVGLWLFPNLLPFLVELL